MSRVVVATPDAAWALLSSTHKWTMWGPSVTAVDPPDATISLGMRGRLRTPLGIWLPFCVTHCDPPLSWAWTVAGISATGHTVEPVTGGCRVSFTVPAVAFPYLAVCRFALRRIATILEEDTLP